MQEALNEWMIMDEENMRFHMGQYEQPYRSTVKFLEFLQGHLKQNEKYFIGDLGCGAGAVLDYILNTDKNMFWGGKALILAPIS
jgi:predicted RNA methylase